MRILRIFPLLAALCVAPPALAETRDCINIPSLPATIGAQGLYCLKQNLETAISSGAAITIDADNVTLDCNDWKIGGLQAGPATQAYGIRTGDRSNVTIRHCGIRGFRGGIVTGVAADATGLLVEDNRFDGITAIAMLLRGTGVIVRRNRVFDTGGAPGSAVSDGIDVFGDGARVTDNVVSGMTVTGLNGPGSTYAFRFLGADAEVAGNLVSGLVPIGSGDARGLYGFKPGSYRDNTIIGTGAQAGFAINGGDATSVCGGNHVRGFATGIFNCVDGGGNAAN